jgi:hypothetical protein
MRVESLLMFGLSGVGFLVTCRTRQADSETNMRAAQNSKEQVAQKMSSAEDIPVKVGVPFSDRKTVYYSILADKGKFSWLEEKIWPELKSHYKIGYENTPFHILNKISIKNVNDQWYEYAFDVGFDYYDGHIVLYPNNSKTNDWHFGEGASAARMGKMILHYSELKR